MMGKFQISNFKYQILITILSLLILAFIATPTQAAPSCNSITLNVSPNPVNAGGSATFSITGEASLYQNNSFTGGVNSCSGAWFDPWNSKTCTTTNAGTYTWTHTWKYCEGSFDNCSPTCSASKTFTVSSPAPPCDTTYKNDRFHACYFNGTNPESGSILSQQDEGALTSPVSSATAFDYDWGGGVVGSSGKTDQVSAIWRGKINFAAGRYVFHVRSDDGVTLDVEGYGRIIDKWWDQAPTTYDSTSINLPAGYRNVAVRWYENGGGAFAKLWWDYTPPPPSPPAGLTASCPGNTATLSWSPTAGATSYMVRADDGDGSNNSANAVGATDNCGPYPHDVCVNGWGSNTMSLNTTAGKTYRWWVHACNSAGCSSETVATPDMACESVIPAPTHGPSSTTTCGRGLTRATGLVSTLTVTADTKFNTKGACAVDTETYFAEKKIPTYEGLKTRYFTQARESSIVKKYSDSTNPASQHVLSYYLNDNGHFNLPSNLLLSFPGDVTLTGPIVGTRIGVVFMEGNLNINQITPGNKLTYGDSNSGLVFVVKGNVIIDPSVTQIDAVIISDGTIYTAGAGCRTSGEAASTLTINGSLINLDKNKPVKFCRTLRNNRQAAEIINQQTKYLVILKDLFSDTTQRWSEVVP